MRVIRRTSGAVRGVLGATVFAWMVIAMSASGQARQQPRTIDSGVYSAEQAKRGLGVYQAECASCHGEKLEGGLGPMLTGGTFLTAWGGRTLTELTDKIQNTMPFQAPGTLTREQSIDIVAYVLQAGGHAAGQAALTAA
ncbi:MAG: cytochrome c, partial [Acidobacteria bacterium]|nr:cytochrome c [Acidobacteriota bacterium]